MQFDLRIPRWLRALLLYFDSRVIRHQQAMARRRCSACGAPEPEQVADFGRVALAGGLLEPGMQGHEKRYPLRLTWCAGCGLVEVADPVKPDELFRRYFYRSSVSLTTSAHLKWAAEDLHKRFRPRTALEIGCNDGVLVRALVEKGVDCVGMDPAAPAVADPRLRIWPAYFSRESAAALGRFDLVVANNVLAHVERAGDVLEGIKEVLEPGGVLAFELHYLPDMLESGQWDWVYHEHRAYVGAATVQRFLARHGLELFDLDHLHAHGGSMRYYAARGGCRKVEDSVALALNAERGRLRRPRRQLVKFGSDARIQAQRLGDHVRGMQARGLKVAGYGASGRAAMIVQHAGLDLDYVVDDTPGKAGCLMPGRHTPVWSPDRLKSDPPDAIVVLAWPYYTEISLRIAATGWRGQLVHPREAGCFR